MAVGRGHAKPVRDSRLKSPASAAMTGGTTRSFQRTAESRPGLGLQRPARPRPPRYDRTGRNAFRKQTAARFRAGTVDYYKAPASLGVPLISIMDTMNESDFDLSRFLYHDNLPASAAMPDQKA